MKKYIGTVTTLVIVLALIVLSLIFSNYSLTENQLTTLMILGIICGASVLYCFIIGETANNFSQMDKLWSILPIVYVWVMAIRGGMSPRLLVYAIIATLWGIRLTMNFARKGAYKLKFWEGEEDYRWRIVRNKMFKERWKWMLFDFFFISLYQNALVLAMTLPMLVCMESSAPFGVFDYIAAVLGTSFLVLETVADEEQWKFQQTKKAKLAEMKELSELPMPFSLGFNTTGLWKVMRHPNYLGEQGIWLSLYFFAIGAGATNYYVFNWTLVGPLLLVLLFLASATLAENISSSKYPKYQSYINQVFKYLPIRMFDPSK